MSTLLSFFCATIILGTHGIGSVTGLTICLATIVSNSAMTIPLKELAACEVCLNRVLSWAFVKATEYILILA